MPHKPYHPTEPNPPTAEEAQRDAELRRLLAMYDQPQPLELPPNLAHQIRAALPDVPPAIAAAADRRRRRGALARRLAVLVIGLVLCLAGFWGIFVDSAGLAGLFGDVSSGAGYLVLLLVLLAKPLIYALLAPGALLLVAVLFSVGLSWLWWRLVRQTPLAAAA